MPRRVVSALGAPAMSETQFQNSIVKIARLTGWLVFHARAGRSRGGRWSTPMQGDSGFPDLVMVGHGRLIFAELKKQDAPGPTAAQQAWLDALAAVVGDAVTGPVEVFVWRPSDLDAVARVLSSKARRRGAAI